MNYPSVNQHLTALDKHSQRHQESLCRLNDTLSNITSKIADLTKEVGNLGYRVGCLEHSYSKKRVVDLTETDSKKRSKVEKSTEE